MPSIFSEDAVDVILQPEAGRYPYYQLASSAIGTRYDARVDPKNAAISDARFNPAWTVATSSEPGRWVVECKIPFKELDGRAAPKDGERWRVNFCRDADSLSRYSSWAFAAGNFHLMENFGEIIFSRSDRGIRLGPLGDWATGKINAQVELTGRALRSAGDRTRKSRRHGRQADPRNPKPPGRLSRGVDQAADARQRPLQPHRPRLHGPGRHVLPASAVAGDQAL